MAVAAGTLPPNAELRANDDMSDYDGTACETNQFFDATVGDCNTDTVANNPGAPPMDFTGLAQDLVSLSDPGDKCSNTQFYSVMNAACWPDTVTNDPKAPVVLEGEDPPPPPPMGPPTTPKPTAP